MDQAGKRGTVVGVVRILAEATVTRDGQVVPPDDDAAEAAGSEAGE
jgi:hypothetical protein